MRQTINKGNTSYSPNLLNDEFPKQAKQAEQAEGGFVSHYERLDGHKIRMRSKSFMIHF